MGCNLQAKDIYGASNSNSFTLNSDVLERLSNQVIVIHIFFKYEWTFFVVFMLKFKYLQVRKLGASKKDYSCDSKLLKIVVTATNCGFSNLGIYE